jgi:hypothetical protein
MAVFLSKKPRRLLVYHMSSDPRDAQFLAQGIDIDSIEAIESLERYSKTFMEGAVQSQRSVDRSVGPAAVGSEDETAATLDEYADLYGQSFKDFARSSFMQGLVSTEGSRYRPIMP